MIADIARDRKIKAHRGGAETLRRASTEVNMSATGEGACAPQIEMYGKTNALHGGSRVREQIAPRRRGDTEKSKDRIQARVPVPHKIGDIARD